MKKRWLALAAAALLLVGTCSCSGGLGGSGKFKDLKTEFEAVDMGGATITIKALVPSTFGFSEGEDDTSKQERNWKAYVEDKYNCTLQMEALLAGSAQTALIPAMLAGSAEWDILSCQRLDIMPMRLAGDLLCNLQEVKSMDITDKRWDQGYVAVETYGPATYSVATKASTAQSGFVVNLDLLSTLKDVDDPFEQVQNYTWDYDAFIKLCKAATEDIDGNTVMDTNDRYGVYLQSPAYYGMLLSNGIRLLTCDDTGKLTYSFHTQNTIDTINYLKEHLVTPNLIAPTRSDQYYDKAFKEGKILMVAMPDWYAGQVMNAVEMNVGWLPVPLGPKGEKKYVNYIDQWMGGYAIPATSKNPEYAGSIIMEYIYCAQYGLDAVDENFEFSVFNGHEGSINARKLVLSEGGTSDYYSAELGGGEAYLYAHEAFYEAEKDIATLLETIQDKMQTEIDTVYNRKGGTTATTTGSAALDTTTTAQAKE